MTDDPYKVLGVSRDATQAEIKKAYRKLAKSLHPDLSPGDKAKAAEFQRVGAAYDIIGDPGMRRWIHIRSANSVSKQMFAWRLLNGTQLPSPEFGRTPEDCQVA
ncbi:J domain-containing protein [Leisingera sp. ANG59]|uniref:J domain-containing protein n=1 Tax=Leisingera sp. ANG59 TaxID=2675221 RepID=UPI001571D350|nr:J domain-containing protein [Leisingera sp. ANG59]NSY41597.1 DnaJ domain-containing protein [Leisingera sp. ANG59]